MSTKPLMLEGIVPKGNASDDQIRELRRENQRLDEALRQVRNELGQALAEKENLERSVRALRNQLSPLHRALRAVFGEIELAVGEEENGRISTVPASQSISSSDPRWESFKQRFPGLPARIIDALQAHREIIIAQLATLLGVSYGATKDAVLKLKKVGAVVQDGKGAPIRLAS